MADLGILALLPAGLAAWALTLRPFVYLVCLTAGSIRLRNEGRDWSEAEAHQIGQQQIINTAVDLVTKGVMAIEWAAILAGIVHICQNIPLHASIWWRGRRRDARLVVTWFKALFADRDAERARRGRAQFEEAGLRRAALFNSEAYDFEPIVWDGLPVDADHARARDEYEHLARKPHLSSAEGSQLALVLLSLQNYGDNPLAVRRGGIEGATIAPQGFLTAGAAVAAVTGGWAWIAPRALVALAIAVIVAGLGWRSADKRADLLAEAQTKLKADYAAAAMKLDAAYARVEDTAKGCLAQIETMRAKAQESAKAEAAARARRQRLAQEKAAAGSAPPIIDPRGWVLDIGGKHDSEPSEPAPAPNPGPVSDGSGGPAAPGG